MTGDYWQGEVYGALPLSGLERCDESAVFDWLSLHLLAAGSKIDWRRVPGRHRHWTITNDVQLVAMASREVRMRLLPDSVVEHVGDGLSPYGVRLTGAVAPSVLGALLEIPEHHYFLAEDRSWLVVVTTEGDLDVVDDLRL